MLSQAVQSLIGDPETRRRMGANGREMVLRSFSQELVAKQTLEIYQELLA